MSLFVEGMECPLCGNPMRNKHGIFGTWGIWLPPNDPLSRFCDASMHWDCYADWPERARFARSYVDFWVEQEQDDPFYSKVLHSNHAFVNVNPHMPFANVWIHLYDTGSRYNVKLKDWDSWVSQKMVEVYHWIDEKPMALTRDILKRRMPTKEILLQSIDLEKKRPLLEKYNAKWQKTEKPPPPTPCPFCGEPLRTNKAKQCPHCFMDWHDSDNVFCRKGSDSK